MRTLDVGCDRLIKSVRAYFADQGVVFIHAFSAEKIQNPPKKYLVSVSQDEVKEKGFVADVNGGIVEAVLVCRVYAPRDADGKDLTALCLSLAQAIRSEGSDIVTAVALSEIRYDTKARTVYRDVRAQISYPKEVVL